MDNQALQIVKDYIEKRFNKSDGKINFEVYIVWKCKILQNCKWLISSSIADGMYYEVTFDGDKYEVYLDAYKRFENVRYKLNKIN